MQELDSGNAQIIRLNTEKYELNQLDSLLDKMEINGIPLAVLHTQVDFEATEKLAVERSRLNIIIESGDRKLIYHYEKILAILKKCPNIYLCSYNFCNWMGHEKIADEVFSQRLLYGSHMLEGITQKAKCSLLFFLMLMACNKHITEYGNY